VLSRAELDWKSGYLRGRPIRRSKVFPMEDNPVLESKAFPSQWKTLPCVQDADGGTECSARHSDMYNPTEHRRQHREEHACSCSRRRVLLGTITLRINEEQNPNPGESRSRVALAIGSRLKFAISLDTSVDWRQRSSDWHPNQNNRPCPRRYR
jgi:hypothetical protein